ncbi:hypothetical protein EVAR_78815_1 [Eumeta japonica]|uniref:Uncharacterized protein n=1 Tax=Eumeta variegata TaxID=151549 RepID=A0A4C1T4G2_EUMVA|nr:hypothetical protein EVAR_78815_1 [Eumeta japonica]
MKTRHGRRRRSPTTWITQTQHAMVIPVKSNVLAASCNGRKRNPLCHFCGSYLAPRPRRPMLASSLVCLPQYFILRLRDRAPSPQCRAGAGWSLLMAVVVYEKLTSEVVALTYTSRIRSECFGFTYVRKSLINSPLVEIRTRCYMVQANPLNYLVVAAQYTTY